MPPASRIVGLLALIAWLAPLPVRGADVDGGPPRVPVVDLRVHLPYQLSLGRTLEQGSGQADVARLARGGVSGVVLPLLATEDGRHPPLVAAYRTLHRALARSSHFAMPGCRTRPGAVRTWLALEDSERLAQHPSEVGLWMQRGVRLFGLVGRRDNSLATSSRHAEPEPLVGLSSTGRAVVREIHAAGGIVDVSHASSLTTREVLELARQAGRPVVASHSNARALADLPRNLSDDEIRAIAASGGVVGITFDRRLLARGRHARLAHVVNHIRHVAKVGGIAHVAIGSGFESGTRPPHELLNAGRFPRLAGALAASGMERADIERVFHGNALRLLCPAGRR